MFIGNHIVIACEVRPSANYNGVHARVEIPVTLEPGEKVEDAIALMEPIFAALAAPADRQLRIMNGRIERTVSTMPLPPVTSADSTAIKSAAKLPKAVPEASAESLIDSSVVVDGGTTMERLLSVSIARAREERFPIPVRQGLVETCPNCGNPFYDGLSPCGSCGDVPGKNFSPPIGGRRAA